MPIYDNDLEKNTTIQRTDFEKWVSLAELTLDTSDDELKNMIKSWLTIACSSEQVLKTNWDINKDYYIWVDKRTDKILDNKSKVIDNRIFTNMETVVPLVTATPAKPVVFIPSAQWKNEKNKEAIRKQSIKTQKILLAIYEDQKLQQKFEKMYRQHQIYRIGIIKYWLKDDKIYADIKLPSRMLLDSEATTMEDSEFIWEKIVDTAKNLINKYPDKEKEISNEVQGKLWTKLTYVEWWTDEIVVTAIWTRIILDKKKNPLFDYTWIPKVSYDEYWEEIKWEPTMHNFFERPKKPYIAFQVYNIWENILDATTTLILSKPLQDNINDRKRQIADNAEVAWNPIRTYTGFRKEQADEANENLRAWDWVNLTDEQSISYVQATSLPAFIQNDLQDSRNSIDNIFGIHSTTRWERHTWWSWESGRAREALREWDEDRQATIWRAIEQVSEELYNAFAHLIKVFYDKPQLIPIMWKKDAEDYIEFKRDDIADWMKIRVKPWSTIPQDPNALKAQWLELLSLWAITKRRAYEMIWMEDAEEAAEELELEWVKAQMEQQELLKKEQAENANQQTAKNFTEQIANLT